MSLHIRKEKRRLHVSAEAIDSVRMTLAVCDVHSGGREVEAMPLEPNGNTPCDICTCAYASMSIRKKQRNCIENI